MIERVIFPNGLQLVAENRLDRRSVALGIWVGVGSRHEEKSHHGIAHFLEHLVFKGTPKRPNSRAVTLPIERTGGAVNAESSKDFTSFFARVPRPAWTTALDVLIEMTTEPLLEDSAISSERLVVFEEIATTMDNPFDLAVDKLASLMWPRHPLGRTGLGDRKSLSRIDQDELRRFLHRHYAPQNTVISAVGPLDLRELTDWIGHRFPPLSPGERPSFQPGQTRQSGPALCFSRKDVEEVTLCFGFRTIPRGHEDRYPIALLDFLLGRGSCSRLFQEVRDKRGLAYDVDTSVEVYEDTGAFLIYAATDKRRAGETVDVIIGELKKIQDEGLPEEELQDIKSQCIGAAELSLEDSERWAEWIGRVTLLEGKPPDMDRLHAKLRAVEAADVQRVAREYFRSDRLNLSIVGSRDPRKAIVGKLTL